MEKQLLKRLALSALVISSVAQAQEGNDKQEQKQTWTEWAKINAQNPVAWLGLGVAGTAAYKGGQYAYNNASIPTGKSLYDTGAAAVTGAKDGAVGFYNAVRQGVPAIFGYGSVDTTAADIKHAEDMIAGAEKGLASAKASRVAANIKNSEELLAQAKADLAALKAKQATPAATETAKTPEVKTPEVKTPEVKTPEVKTPEVKTPEVKTPAATATAATTEVKTVDLPSKHVTTKEEAAGKSWSAYFGSFVPTRVSDAWKNNSYYNNQIAYGVGALAAGYTTYKLGKAAYNWYNTPSKIEMKGLVKDMTLEAATKAKSDVAQFAKELSTMVENGFAQLGLGQAGQAMKSADEIFTAKLSKENPVADALLVQQTAMKDMYTQIKGRIEQWQKADVKTRGYVAGRMPYGSLYNTTVVAAINDATAAINAKIAELSATSAK